MDSNLDLKPNRFGRMAIGPGHGSTTQRLVKWIEDMEYDGVTALLNK